MTVFVALVLTVLTFAAVIMPFFRSRTRPVSAGADEKSQELFFKRDTTLAMLKELEFDYQSGTLTEKDYRDLEDRYKRKGISILKDIDRLPEDARIDAAIEKQVSRLRGKRPEDVSDEIEEKIAGLRKRKPAGASGEIKGTVHQQGQSKSRFCPQCGTKLQPGGRFCVQCGVKLS